MKIKIFKLFIVTFLITFSKSDKLFAQMFWNQACSFSGNPSSYISVRPTSTVNITGSFTIEAWLKISTLTGISQGIVSKGGPYGASMNYAVRISPAGKIEVLINGAIRLVSNSALPLNTWTHVAVVHNCCPFSFTPGYTIIYINEVPDIALAFYSNIIPASTPDSLFIGMAGLASPYTGIMDELRIWNRHLSNSEIIENMRLSLGAGSGRYNNLILSMTFQKEVSGGVKFNCNDWSNHQNYGRYYAVTPVDLTDQPSQTIGINKSFYSGGDGYLAGADDPDISPTQAITLQAWIYPVSNSDAVIIYKGPPTGAANYNLSISNKKLTGMINGITFDSQDTIPLNQWSHVAFTYFNISFSIGSYGFYVNGKIVRGGTSFGVGNIIDGTDSLHIGGAIGLPSFSGSIDEVRISSHAKNEAGINDSLYVSMENGSNIPGVTIVYNFDGYTYCNSLRGPILNFRQGSFGGFSDIIYNSYVSPLNKGSFTSFQKGFYMKTSDRRIPTVGTTGPMTDDTLDIFLDEIINDVNVYIALNHKNIASLQVSLVAPNGNSVQLMNANSLVTNSSHVVTVFDDNAGYALVNNTYTSFSPSIKPLNNIGAVFNGSNSKGLWRLVINDMSGSDSGRLYAWGIQINNKSILPKLISGKCIIQGFYNESANNMIRDTIKSYLRNSTSPFALIDSSKVYLQADGSGVLRFNSSTIIKGTKYYLQIKHRNSIETWSNTTGVIFEPLTSQSTYNFTTDRTKAFGNNLIQVDNSPIKFAIYSGDVNQDGLVDLTDASFIDNDLFNFVSGYVVTDLTGDNTVDLSDAVIADNNALNFVSKVTP